MFRLFLLTVSGAFLVTVCMCLGIMIGAFFGRWRQRRCACAEARRVARLLEERKRQEREARNYSPEDVDPNSLPIIDAETVRKH